MLQIYSKFEYLGRMILTLQPVGRPARIFFCFAFIGGAIMPAMSVLTGTIYACKLDFLNGFLTQDDPLQGVLKIFEIAGIYGPYRN